MTNTVVFTRVEGSRSMGDVIDVEGIGEVYSQKLKDIGIATTEALLERGASRTGRAKIAEESGISDALILRWVNHVDLFRINGVERQYSELLEAAGVDSVPELAQRVPANLHAKLVEINDARNLVRKLPTENQVADWVAEAKTLPRVVTH
jgi:predicted flap endonuclease-1-like 5' DNA nuclease